MSKKYLSNYLHLFKKMKNVAPLLFVIAIISILFSFNFIKNVKAQDSITVDEFSVPTSSAYTTEIANGLDGNLWFTESNTNTIGKIATSGAITEFTMNQPSNPVGITSGPDGNIWFTESDPQANSIGRITPDGAITHFHIPTNNSLPQTITSGPDGNLWFTEYGADKIGRITPSGVITEFPVPNNNGESLYLYAITTGPDGNLWFTESDVLADKIGKITPQGTITEYSLPTSRSSPTAITTGPDGNLWYIVADYHNGTYDGSRIGRITINGSITEFPYNGTGVPYDITTGSDGNLWFTERLNSEIGQITPSGTITEFSVPNGDNRGIAKGPDDNLWYAETSVNKIARLSSISAPTPTPTPTPAIKDYKQNRNADGSLVPWANETLFNLTNCASMASEGCAITSLADVIASYGLQTLPDASVINPGNLNNYLAQNPGTYSGCSIYFNTAGRAVNFTVLQNDFPWVPLQTRIQHIDDALSSGNLVIAGIGGHFVVLYKKAANPAADGSPDYYIADPYRYVPYATGDRSGMLLSQAYHSIDQLVGVLQVVVLNNKTPEPGESWSIVAHSPVTFLVTDPNGNQTGFDPSSNTTVEAIPNSSYGIQQGLIDDTGINPPQPDILYYGQENPAEGTYEIKVTGTGSGEYTLDFAESTGPGNSSLQTVEGTASIGKTDTYIITNSSDSNNQQVISKDVTFDTLRADLLSLYQRDLIDNKGIYTSLKAEVDIAEKANMVQNPVLRLITTKLAFVAITNELNAQRDKRITEDAYQILINDVHILQNSNNVVSPTPTPSGGGS